MNNWLDYNFKAMNSNNISYVEVLENEGKGIIRFHFISKEFIDYEFPNLEWAKSNYEVIVSQLEKGK